MADAEAERLYGLPLDEFTAARDARARELRQDGEREKAAEVAALRKPVLAAWVVNMLARDERGDIRELVAAAKRIREGKEGADAAFREVLERLTTAGRRLLEAEGRSADATLQQVAGTLRAAAAGDPELLAAGTLTQPVESSGFGAMAGASSPPPRSRTATAQAAKSVDRRAVERARKALTEARDEARALARAATAAEREADKAREAAEQARRQVAEAEARLADVLGT
ncbi:MAG TPA: hypothetical protein VFG75_04015 [Gaiella sp.]|nr:hypothetical protein [Gaiella sp.]